MASWLSLVKLSYGSICITLAPIYLHLRLSIGALIRASMVVTAVVVTDRAKFFPAPFFLLESSLAMAHKIH